MMVQTPAGKDQQLDPAQVQAVRAMLGAPRRARLWDQYVGYLGQLFHGTSGISYTYFPYPVTEVIGQALPWTLILVDGHPGARRSSSASCSARMPRGAATPGSTPS